LKELGYDWAEMAHSSAWAGYSPANVRGYVGPAFGLGIAFANTGGQDSASGTEPIPPSNAGTTALDTAGVVYDGTPNSAFNKIVTSLVLRNLVDVLRMKLTVLQAGAFLRAKHVPGTKEFVYTMFADLGAAEDLLEGVPPVTAPLAWDTFSFTGGQKGKLVAVTDLAELFSPFELYSIAAEKVAWNALETAEAQAATLFMSTVGIGPVGNNYNQPTIASNLVAAVVDLEVAEVPMFPDGTYHALISPADAGAVMLDTKEDGWMETMKYNRTEAILNGEIGQFRNVRFIKSNRISNGKTVIFGPGAIAWGDYQTIQAYRVAPGGDHADPLAQRGLVGWKGMWGMKIVGFAGTPAAGPASNTGGLRFTVADLLNTSS
jgi:N4-gp56 family major capsid protein